MYKVSRTDLIRLLLLLKDMVDSKSRSDFELAWINLSETVSVKERNKIQDWLIALIMRASLTFSFRQSIGVDQDIQSSAESE